MAGGDAAAALQQGGLLDSLKKALAECALNAEMDHHHFGHDEQAGDNGDGYGRKTVLADTGKIVIEVLCDRHGSFDPQLIAKYQCPCPGFDDKIASMYAGGINTREIAGHVRELYGIDFSPDLITTFTDAVLKDVAA